MENPMLQMLVKSRQSSPTNNLINMLQNSNNPQQLIQNLVTQNPQITNIINKYGNGDPKTAFFEYARMTGQDPEKILSMLRNFK